MTTTNGVPKIHRVRQYIETLETRRSWLIQKVNAKCEQWPHYAEALRLNGTFESVEIEAIDYALGLLDADWDNLMRMRRNIERVQSRQDALDRSNSDHTSLGSVPAWVAP